MIYFVCHVFCQIKKVLSVDKRFLFEFEFAQFFLDFSHFKMKLIKDNFKRCRVCYTFNFKREFDSMFDAAEDIRKIFIKRHNISVSFTTTILQIIFILIHFLSITNIFSREIWC